MSWEESTNELSFDLNIAKKRKHLREVEVLYIFSNYSDFDSCILIDPN